MLLSLFNNRQTSALDVLPRTTEALTGGTSTAFQDMFRSSYQTYDYTSANARDAVTTTDYNADRANARLEMSRSEYATRDTGYSTAMSTTQYAQQNRPAPQATESVQQTQSGDNCQSRTAAQEQSESEADAAAMSDRTQKLQALLDKIEQELAKDPAERDEATMDAVMQLLAALLTSISTTDTDAADQTGQALQTTDADSDALTLTIAVPQDSELMQLLQQLAGTGDITQQTGDSSGNTALDAKSLLAMHLQADPQQVADKLKEVKVLLKLSDDSGLLIPLTDMAATSETQTGDENQTALNLALQLTQGEDGETLTLTISAEALESAQFVNLSKIDSSGNVQTAGSTNADAASFELTVPIEQLMAAREMTAVSNNAAAMQDKAAENTVAVILEALGITQEELAASLTSGKAEGKTSRIGIPLQINQDGTATAEAAETIVTSDVVETQKAYLDALDKLTLAKMMTDAKANRSEIYKELQKTLENISTDTTAFAALKTGSGYNSLMQVITGITDATAKQADEWAAVTTKETLVSNTATAKTDESSSSRIAFLGRLESAEKNLQQLVSNKADATTTRNQTAARSMQENVMHQINQKVSYSALNGTGGEIRIALRPANLGDLHLKIATENDVVVAKFTAQSQEVKAIIENNLGQLKDSLQQQGLKVGKFEVNVNTGGGNSNQYSSDAQTGDTYMSQYGSAVELDEDGMATPLDDSTTSLYGGSVAQTGGSPENVNYLA